MTIQEAILYIENQTWSGTKLGLSRTRELMARLGNIQEALEFIHVAGSNGKGSTCAMLSSVLRSAGYKTGLYISPHLVRFNERMSIDGREIPDAELAELTEIVREAAEAMEDHPSQFEISTAIALLYFYRNRCDIVIMEVGLGGEADSTNVIPAPVAAVITNLGLEHTEYLGDTIEEIASAKAGIIKPGCRCVCYNSSPEAVGVVKETCRRLAVPFTLSDNTAVEPLGQYIAGAGSTVGNGTEKDPARCENETDPVRNGTEKDPARCENETVPIRNGNETASAGRCQAAGGQRFRYKGKEYVLGLLGRHQLRNAATVIDTVQVLREAGRTISEEALKCGLAQALWPARMEILGLDPLFLLDGGHNPQCTEALVENWQDIFGSQRAVFLIGVLADKDYPAMMSMLLPYGRFFVCLTPDSPRALPAAKLAEYLKGCGAQTQACETVEEGIRMAVKAAKEADCGVVSFGSLYLAGTVRELYPANVPPVR